MADANSTVSRTPEPEQAASDIPDDRSTRKPGHSRKGWLIAILLLVAVILLVVFFSILPREREKRQVEKEAREKSQQKPRVQAYIVRRSPTASELMVPGTTLAYTEAYVYARASGYISHRYVDIGDHVRAGQVLATIDSPDLDAQVAQARSAVLQSQASLVQQQAQLHLNSVNFERYKVLVAKGVFSRQQGDQQEADFRVSEANVRAAENVIQGNRDNLQHLVVLQGYERVTAPFSGVITARNVDVGSLISAQGAGLGSSSSQLATNTTQAGADGNNQGVSGSLSSSVAPTTGGNQGGQMFSMADTTRLRALVSVPEAYSAAIRVGQRAQLFFQDQPSAHYEGRVSRTSSNIDPNTRTLLVEVLLANPQGRLLPGMYVTVNFVDIQGERPLLVPGESIIVRGGKQMVASLQNNVVRYVPIIIGRDYGDQTELLGGLHEGDAIVRTISDQVENGAQVDPQFPKQPPAQEAGGQSDKQPVTTGQYGEQGLDNSAQKAGKAGKSQSGGKSQGQQGGSNTQ